MPEIIRISLDTKFNDYNGRTFDDNRIDPISIGICNIDIQGQHFYAVSADFNKQSAMQNPRVDKRILKNIENENAVDLAEIQTLGIYYLVQQIHLNHSARHIEFWGKNPVGNERCLAKIFHGHGNLENILEHMGMHSVTFKNITDVTKIIDPVNPSPFFGEKGANHALRDALIQSEMFRWAEREREFAKEHKLTGFIKRNLTRMAGFRPF